MAITAGNAPGEPSPPSGSDDQETPTPPPAEVAWDDTDIDTDADTGDGEAAAVEPPDEDVLAAAKVSRWSPNLRFGLIAGVVVVLALGGVAGWLGVRAHHAQQSKQESERYLHVAKQGAVNLTTIDSHEADTDIQRILDTATGQFYDDFAQRSAPFVEVVKQTQSKTVGTVTEAGLESVNGDQAQAIVALNVLTSNVAAGQQPPRTWRIRMNLQRMGEDIKISNVSFVQ